MGEGREGSGEVENFVFLCRKKEYRIRLEGTDQIFIWRSLCKESGKSALSWYRGIEASRRKGRH